MSSNTQPLSGASLVPISRSSLNSLLTSLVLDSDTGTSSFLVSTGGQKSLYIDAYSNVGINHTSPAAQLDINSPNGSCLLMRYNGTANTASMYLSSNGQLTLASSGNEINTTSNLNIKSHNGTTSGLLLNNTLVTSSAAQLNYVNVATGQATANKAMILDGSKNITGIGSLEASTLTGTVNTAAQPLITSVGTLTGLNISGNLSLSGNLVVAGSTFSASSMSYISSVTPGTALPSKALILNSTSDITSGINQLTVNSLVGSIATASQPLITSVGTLTSLSVSGGVSLTSTTDSSSTSTGALIVSGGIGISKNLYVGTGIYGTIQTQTQNQITSLGTLTGLAVSGTTTLTDQTDSTSNTSGALVVSGGIGVAKNIYVGGNAVVSGNLTVNGTTTTIYSTSASVADNTMILNSGPAGSGKDSGFLVQRFQNDNNTGSGDVVSDTEKLSTTITSATTTSITLASGANTNNEYYTNWWIKITSGAANNNVRKIISYDGTSRVATLSTAMTATPTNGATVNLYNKQFSTMIWQESTKSFTPAFVSSDSTSTVDIIDRANMIINKVNVIDTTQSTTSTSGSITTSGGVGINNTTDASSSTNGGALTVAGGAAIAKSVQVGTNISIGGNTITPTQASYLSGSTAGTATANKAVVLGASGEIGTIASLTATDIYGSIKTPVQTQITSVGTLSSLSVSGNITAGSNTITPTQVGYLSSVVAGTAAANKVLVLGASGDIGTITSLTATDIYGTIRTSSQSQITSIGTLTSLTVSGQTSITANTVSTNASSGALVVTGGVGIGGAINVTGNISSSGTISATSITGTIGTPVQNTITSVGTLTSLTVSGITSITASTTSTTTTNGALVVTGGVGIGGSLNLGGSLIINGTTFTNAQAGYLTGITPGTVSNSKAVIASDTGSITGLSSLSSNAIVLNGTNLSTTLSGIQTNLDPILSVTAGTVSANKAIIANGTKDVSGLNSLSVAAITLNGTDLQTTINNSTAAQLQGVTEGTVTASKAIVVDANKDISSFRNLTATNLTGTLQTAAQPNITSTGTLSSVMLTPTSRTFAAGITSTGCVWASGSDRYYGARQIDSNTFVMLGYSAAGSYQDFIKWTHGGTPNLSITGSVGMTGLSLNGTTVNSTATELNYLSGVTLGTASNSKVLTVSGTGTIDGLTALTATNLYGTIQTVAQPQITSVGVLTSLSSSGAIAFSSGTDASSSTVGGTLTVSGGAAIAKKLYVGTGIYGTIQTASQPQITSIGTLTSLSMSGSDTMLTLTNTANTGRSNAQLVCGTTSYQIGVRGESAGQYPGSFYLYNNLAGTYRMVVDTNGNTGIGTISASPSYTLHVTGSLSATSYYLGTTLVDLGAISGVTAGSALGSKAVILNSSSGVSGLGAVSCTSLTSPTISGGTSSMLFQTDGITRMQIWNTGGGSGTIGIGGVSNYTGGQTNFDLNIANNVIIGTKGGPLDYDNNSLSSFGVLHLIGQPKRNTFTAASSTDSTHRANVFINPSTLSATNTGVVTSNASTVYIGGAPSSGTNNTISNAWALFVNSGNSRFGGTITATGSITTGGQFLFSSSSWIGSSSAIDVGIVTSGSYRLYVNSSGFIGVNGNTSPRYDLDFGSTTDLRHICLYGVNDSTSGHYGFGASGSMINYLSSNTGHAFYTGSTRDTAGTERVRISSSGITMYSANINLNGNTLQSGPISCSSYTMTSGGITMYGHINLNGYTLQTGNVSCSGYTVTASTVTTSNINMSGQLSGGYHRPTYAITESNSDCVTGYYYSSFTLPTGSGTYDIDVSTISMSGTKRYVLNFRTSGYNDVFAWNVRSYNDTSMSVGICRANGSGWGVSFTVEYFIIGVSG